MMKTDFSLEKTLCLGAISAIWASFILAKPCLFNITRPSSRIIWEFLSSWNRISAITVARWVNYELPIFAIASESNSEFILPLLLPGCMRGMSSDHKYDRLTLDYGSSSSGSFHLCLKMMRLLENRAWRYAQMQPGEEKLQAMSKLPSALKRDAVIIHTHDSFWRQVFDVQLIIICYVNYSTLIMKVYVVAPQRTFNFGVAIVLKPNVRSPPGEHSRPLKRIQVTTLFPANLMYFCQKAKDGYHFQDRVIMVEHRSLALPWSKWRADGLTWEASIVSQEMALQHKKEEKKKPKFKPSPEELASSEKLPDLDEQHRG